MAYEVIKHRGGRAYRYRVEYKRKGDQRLQVWTYLGIVEKRGPSTAKAVNEQVDTRMRLLDAVDTLVTRVRFDELTVDTICRHADLTPGTFYRYFGNKHEAFAASVTRYFCSSGLHNREPKSNEDARKLIYEYAVVSRRLKDRVGLTIAFARRDPRMLGVVQDVYDRSAAELGAYLQFLVQRGYSRLRNPEMTAQIWIAAIKGVVEMSLEKRLPLDDAMCESLAELFVRGIFCRDDCDTTT